jgi:glutamate-1-semialdehyde 2,1-aminomutase
MNPFVGKSQSAYSRAKKLIPGGTQLLSKRPEMNLPDGWPSYYSSAKGCRIRDLDDREYLDFTFMSLGACTLGYANDEIADRVVAAIRRSTMTTLNAPEELELAERLTQLHSWADMARFARTGGEINTVAIRIARAATGRDIILFCGYHGWHDWYMACNLASAESLEGHLLPGLSPKGVPKGLKGSSFPFSYNDLDAFENLLNEHKGKIAGVIMEPMRSLEPSPGFLEQIRSRTSELGIVLIFDEISAAFRSTPCGIHSDLGVNPDVATFGKALSNGYPMAAMIGVSEVMHAAQDSFISSTYWTDNIGPTASLAVLDCYGRGGVCEKLIEAGKRVKLIWERHAEANGIEIDIYGLDPLCGFKFLHPEALALKTLLSQEMMRCGVLATTAFYACIDHDADALGQFEEAVEKVFPLLAQSIVEGSITARLEGPVCHEGFRRLA